MSYALHRIRMRLVFAAIFALGFAQLGAVAHGYSHDAVAQSRTSHPSGTTSHEACNDCIAYAALLAAAGTPASLCVPPAGPAGSISAGGGGQRDDFLKLAFRSRAPPVAP